MGLLLTVSDLELGVAHPLADVVGVLGSLVPEILRSLVGPLAIVLQVGRPQVFPHALAHVILPPIAGQCLQVTKLAKVVRRLGIDRRYDLADEQQPALGGPVSGIDGIPFLSMKDMPDQHTLAGGFLAFLGFSLRHPRSAQYVIPLSCGHTHAGTAVAAVASGLWVRSVMFLMICM